MKKYEQLSLTATIFMGDFVTDEKKTARKVIDEYAAKGYRFAGIVPVNITGDGIRVFDLVFEKEE